MPDRKDPEIIAPLAPDPIVDQLMRDMAAYGMAIAQATGVPQEMLGWPPTKRIPPRDFYRPPDDE
jgi:hypothetical protein